MARRLTRTVLCAAVVSTLIFSRQSCIVQTAASIPVSYTNDSTVGEKDKNSSPSLLSLLQELLLDRDYLDQVFQTMIRLQMEFSEPSLASLQNETVAPLLTFLAELRDLRGVLQDCPMMCFCPDQQLAADLLAPHVREWFRSLNSPLNVSDYEIAVYLLQEFQQATHNESASFLSKFRVYLEMKQYTGLTMLLKSARYEMAFCFLQSNETLRLSAAVERQLFPAARNLPLQTEPGPTETVNSTQGSERSPGNHKYAFNLSVTCETGAKVIVTQDTHITSYKQLQLTNCDVIVEGLPGVWDMSLTSLFLVRGDLSWIRNLTVEGPPCSQNMVNISEQHFFDISPENETEIYANSCTIFPSVRDVWLVTIPLRPSDLSDVFRWFQGSGKLVLVNNDLGDVTCSQLVPSPAAWTYVKISHNGLRSVPTCALRPTLIFLDLSNNAISDISSFQFPEFVPAPNMHILNLNDNEITDVGIMTDMNVNILLLAGNQISHLNKMSFTRLVDLSVLDLSRNHIRVLDPGTFRNSINMLLLNLNDNELESFDSYVIPPLFLTFSVFLMNNRLSHPPFRKNNYTVQGSIRVYAGDNPFACDCDMSSYLQALSDPETSAGTIFRDRHEMICRYPRAHHGVLLDDFQAGGDRCPVVSGCPPECVCELSRSLNVIFVDCVSAGGVRQLPLRMPDTYDLSVKFRQSGGDERPKLELTDARYLDRMVSLNVSAMGVSAVSELFCEGLPRAKLLDLSNNNISRLPECFRSRAAGQSTLQLVLAGNPWACTCENAWMQGWLKSVAGGEDVAKEQSSGVWVPDADIVTCSDTTRPHTRVMDWDASSCVPTNYLPWVIAVSALLGLMVVVGPILYVHRLKVMITIHATYGVRPFTRARHFDEGKFQYELLIVPGDDVTCETFVVQVLLPKLNAARHRLCIPSRDFVPGESIAQSFLEAVERSKAVLCLVSRQTMREEWWLYAFQLARAHSARDPNVLLLLVLLEPVLDEGDCPQEVTSFLKSNTYLTFPDNWFWKKLFYYLPEPPHNIGGVPTA